MYVLGEAELWQTSILNKKSVPKAITSQDTTHKLAKKKKKNNPTEYTKHAPILNALDMNSLVHLHDTTRVECVAQDICRVVIVGVLATCDKEKILTRVRFFISSFQKKEKAFHMALDVVFRFLCFVTLPNTVHS